MWPSCKWSQEWVWGDLASFLSTVFVVVTTLWALPVAHPFPLAMASVMLMDHIVFGHLSHSQFQLWLKGLQTLGCKPFWWRLPLCYCLICFIFYKHEHSHWIKGCVINFIRNSQTFFQSVGTTSLDGQRCARIPAASLSLSLHECAAAAWGEEEVSRGSGGRRGRRGRGDSSVQLSDDLCEHYCSFSHVYAFLG